MRQRKVKNEEEKIARYAAWIAAEPAKNKGRWAQDFPMETPPAKLYLEIGCGKGKFITHMARENPRWGYIAVEGAGTVVLRALEKAAGVNATVLEDGAGMADGSGAETDGGKAGARAIGEPLYNLRFITDYVQTLGDIFLPGEISGIYLNFSDPWPKERHGKRRLTHRKYLAEYRKILKPGSTLEFKSDNDDLFAFSVQEFYDFGLEILELTDDLHGVLKEPACSTKIFDGDGREVVVPAAGEGAFASALATTEYEDRFTAEGKNIHYCKVKF